MIHYRAPLCSEVGFGGGLVTSLSGTLPAVHATAHERIEASRQGALATTRAPAHLALFMRSLKVGGVERSMLHLANAFAAEGHRVDLVLCRDAGPFSAHVGASVRRIGLRRASNVRGRVLALRASPGSARVLLRPVLLPLAAWKELGYLPDLVRYLREERPMALLSATTYPNLMALWARRLAGVATRVVVSERNPLSGHMAEGRNRWRWRWRHVAPLVGRTYATADAVIAISDGVAEDVAATAHLPRGKIQTIYNPVVAPDLMTRARAAVQHPWLAPGAWPVVLGVGRLKPAKDFATLIRAFARVRRERGAHLVILGEGEERPALEALARELGVDADVDLPGFVENPQAWMSRASLLALSSRWEGLANVLIEALACGCPVVSTDCPGGPGEVLDRGAFGRLVPVGDHAALADAIRAMLDEPVDRARLRARGASFSIASSARAYLAAMLPDECPR